MKNLIKFSIVMVVLCITACTQTFENTSNEVQKKAQGRLVMKVGNESRTIKPTIGESDVKTAVLTANGNEIKSWSDDNIIRQIENTEDILLDVGNYDFTMTFRNADNIDILTASTSLEIVAGDNILDFKMKPVTTGTGDISITLTWDVVSGIDKITAGLYDIATNDFLEGFGDRELDITTSNEQKSTTLYSLSGVPVGQYIIKFKIYEGETYEKHLNTLSEVIHVAAGITTSSQITLSKINTQYSITYNPNGGTWTGNFIVTDERNANKKITLPTANDITREGYEFAGWYDNDNNKITEIPSDTAKNISVTAKWLQLYTITYNLNGGENNTNNPTSYTVETETITLGDPTKGNSRFLGWYNESGDKITKIIPSETAANITVTARWSTTCTADNVSSVITSLSGDGPHDIVVQDGITSDTIPTIKSALDTLKQRNNSAKVNLDLSHIENLTELPDKAFQNCGSLTSVTIGNNVKTIGNYAFDGCRNLTSVTIGDSVTTIGNYAFQNCNILTSVTIPDSVTSIGEYAFCNCYILTSVTIGDSVTSIGEYAFQNCYDLTSVTIGDSVTTIGKNAFDCCRNLTSIIIPNSMTTIGKSAFSGCYGLTSVTIPDSVTSIGDSAFYNCCNLTSVTIPDSVASIGESAFIYCSKLTSIVIPAGVTTIGTSAFEGCSGLESVTIPDSVTTISDSAFKNCKKLTSVTIPASVTTISDNTFKYCDNLTSVTIPASVTSIGSDAFYGCSSLTTVNYKGTQDEWVNNIDIKTGNSALTDATRNYYSFKVTSDDVSSKILGLGEGSYTIIVTEAIEDTTISDINTALQNNSKAMVNLDLSGTTGLTSIVDSAFEGSDNLTSLTIPDNVTSIGTSAFEGCSGLESVTIPDSVESIGEYAFYNCDNLTSVTIPAGVTIINGNTFAYCDKLTSVTIPVSVIEIVYQAFYCCSSLRTVNYKGTQEEWNKITGIGQFVNATINYYSFKVTSDNVSDTISNLGEGSYTIIVTGEITSETISAINTALQKSSASVTINFTITVTADNVSDAISKLTERGSCTIIVTGEISNTTISAIKGALQSNSNAKVNLDLSGTTELTSISDSAFFHCTGLTSVTIGGNVKSIGGHAFNGCGLKSVTIGDKVESIGDSAFCDCHSLKSVTIGDKVESIANYAFGNCSSLTSVTIGNSVTSIGISVFSGCSSLTTVNYKGTQEEWNQKIISGIGSGNEALTNATINYGYTGE